MATVKIYNAPTGLTSKISNKDFGSSKINDINFNVKLDDGQPITKSIKNVDTHIKISNVDKNVRINQILPFRVKFINVQVPSYMGGIPPIGIAIIGVNNYIL